MRVEQNKALPPHFLLEKKQYTYGLVDALDSNAVLCASARVCEAGS